MRHPQFSCRSESVTQSWRWLWSVLSPLETRNYTYRRVSEESLDSCKTVQAFGALSQLGQDAEGFGTQSYLQEVPNTLPVEGVVAVAL